MALYIGLAVLALIVGYVATRKRPPRKGLQPSPLKAAPAKRERVMGRMLRPGTPSCAQAQELSDRWFRGTEAPPLPVEGCPLKGQCRCTWERAFDRREGPRRLRQDRRTTIRFDTKPDRRKGPDRRKDQQDVWRGE